MNDDPTSRSGPPVRIITGQLRPPVRRQAPQDGPVISAAQGTFNGRIALPASFASRLTKAEALLDARDFAAAEQALDALAAEDPASVELRHVRGKLLFHRQQWREAEALWDELRRLRPDDADIAHGHAATLARLRRFRQAREALTAVVQRWPDYLLARLNLAGMLRQEFRRPREALAVLEPALAQHGGNATLHFNMGRARQDLLDTEGALASYQQAIDLDPGHIKALSAYPFCTHYLPRPDLDALRAWTESHARALRRPPAPAHPATHTPGARLRVGLLSGDLSDHPVAYFLESALTALQRRGVELVAYSTGDKADATTQRLARLFTTWRPVAALSEPELAQRIADDRLDVLLDLAGFTNHHRLAALLMKPAPVQLSWLGYFGTQGVPEMDGVIADPHCVPPDEQRFFTERVLYLPHTRLCMSPPAGAPEPVAEPPLATGAGLRFACLQNLNKINERVLAAWKRILDGAPHATLLIQGRQLSQPDVREAFEARLQASGIARSRIELGQPSGRAEYLAAYGGVDVLLDTFPYPGGTTTAEAIWMGVPTLTLATPGMLGRQGQALLHNVGLGDWITHSDEAYVQRAISLANDRDGTLATLRRLRGTLRESARSSPLFDAETFARDFEVLLRRACTEGVAAIAGQIPPVHPPVPRTAPAPGGKAARVAHFNALMQAGDLAAAEPVLMELLALDPGVPPLRQALAALRGGQGRHAEAEALWRALVTERPDDPGCLHGHALSLLALRRHGEARALLERLVAGWPDFLAARLPLATLLQHHDHQPQSALALLTPALPAHPSHAALQFAIGRARHDLLDPDGALAACERAITLDPASIEAYCTYAFCAHHVPAPDLGALRQWLQDHAPALPRPVAPLATPRPVSGDRPLRVGLLSGDFKDHPVTYFLESVLAALPRQGVELFAYATGSDHDAATARVRALVGHWCDAAPLTDLALARRIADDRLDVLLDLAGFTQHSRLGVLLMRPAPRQLSWLGYFGTLGVPEIDGVVADPHCVPAQEQHFFSERVLRLPHTRLCMSPPAGAPEVSPEPPLATGTGLRFACFQDLRKINARVLAAWKRILDGAPHATLLLRGRQLAQPEVRAVFEARIKDSGIDLARVTLDRPRSRPRYLAGHAEVDVLLDTFPYPGGTTTAEAVWMGVPTLTLATPGMLGRQGQAMLHLVGLGDWITHSDDAYVQRAVSLANDRDGTLASLRQLRRTLRETARVSPLFDADGFARDFAALLRRECGVGATESTVDGIRRFNQLVADGQMDAAEQTLRGLLARDPKAGGLRQAMAALLYHRERWNEAAPLLAELVREQPDDATQQYRLGAVLRHQEKFAEARTVLETVVRRWPGQLQPRLTLAKLLQRPFQLPRQALDVLTPALNEHGGSALLHSEIALMQQDLLDTEGALASYQQAIARDPAHMTSFGAHAFCSHYLPAPDLDALRAWQAVHQSGLRRTTFTRPAAAARAPGEHLRVGLVSGDLRNHPVAYFLESVIAALHARGVQLFAYSGDTRHDAVSQRLQQHTHTWRKAHGLSDTALAQRIADDRLDVLLDLSGFTSHGRPGLHLMRPAPLQLQWLGYFGSLGLPEVDGVIADPHCVPEGEQRFFSERVWRMPHTRLCMTAPADAPAPAAEPPLSKGSGLRFACLQDLNKINVRVLAAWKRILDGAPQATLLIQGRQLSQPEVRAVFEARLDASGIDRSRLTLGLPRSRADYLAGYADIDVLLDTFPYPGGTTTAEAIWMGVPTLTLATPGMLGRQGQAMLHQVGLDDWVTHSDGAYAERAIALASDRDGTIATLRQLRRTLRETARTSPLFDAETFARDFEALLRRACTESVSARAG
ncbi:O-linked N-acetylglucosamine transferase family protein [Hydrogenophaga sp. MI9]|uniref:O-linked N-acetylglucosamine transferase, SPINDLY family protein n=1 Tax=Hydrogenophaga sp. MI9 TaxID=3453719 RepID=UPI003EE8CDF2